MLTKRPRTPRFDRRLSLYYGGRYKMNRLSLYYGGRYKTNRLSLYYGGRYKMNRLPALFEDCRGITVDVIK